MHIHVYSDPGHAWGKVSEFQLERLGLTFGHFSSYSYRRGDFIYLEKDDDLSYFAKVHAEKLGKAPTWGEHHSNKSSRIRNYSRNQPTEAYEQRKQPAAIPITSLNFERAGSDFLGFAWSAHVTGYDFVKGKTYTITREDDTTYEVIAVGQERVSKDGPLCWHILDPEDALMVGGTA